MCVHMYDPLESALKIAVGSVDLFIGYCSLITVVLFLLV